MTISQKIRKTITSYIEQTGRKPTEIIVNADEFMNLQKECKHGLTKLVAKKIPPDVIIFEGVTVKKGK